MIGPMELRERVCEACGEAFGCGSETGGRCWCDEIVVDAATLARLRAAYERCLCPRCLRRAAAGGAPPAPAAA